MVKHLSISNYKSIKDLDMQCRKVNVFIGEPNSGKSNIIEALSLFSKGVIEQNGISRDIIRYNNIGDLFFDFTINRPIEVKTDIAAWKLEYPLRENGAPENEFHLQYSLLETTAPIESFRIEHDGRTHYKSGRSMASSFRFYEYRRVNKFEPSYTSYLSVPHGDNLASLLLSNEECRTWVEEFFDSKGYILTLKPAENEISMSKMVQRRIYSYPYQSISETLQRVVFYMMAMQSNKEAVLLLDEPESNTFPFYTSFIAERIALDDTNQFFLTTHNPYLLLNLIEKSKAADINVCVVSMKDYQTKVTVLDQDQIAQVLSQGFDVFLNLDRIVD